MAIGRRPAGVSGEPSLGVEGARHIALYVQLAGVFRHRVVTGEWPEGFMLPSLETLAGQFGVARITVRQAVALLVSEGLLATGRGRGTWVLGGRDDARLAPADANQASDALGPESSSLEIRVLERERPVELPADYAGGHPARGRYVEITKLHLEAGEHFGMMRIFVAEDVFDQLPARLLTRRKILRMIVSGAPEHSAGGLEQTVTVEPADFVLSGHLDYPFGSPVARIMRRAFDDAGRIVYAGASWYRGDRFMMRVTLPRSVVVDSPPALLAPVSRAGRIRQVPGSGFPKDP
jgi:GntR family transcriptional regulator